MGATTDNYVVISADCHGGASIAGYKPFLASKYHDDFDAWAADFDNPYDDNTGADADRNWSSERRLRGDGGRRRRRRGHLPEHDPAVLPEGLAREPAARRDRRRPGQAVGRPAGAQPVAGRLLQPGPGPPGRHRPDHAPRRRRVGEGDRVGQGERPDRRHPAARRAARFGCAAAVRARLRADLGRLRGPRPADQPPQRQRRPRHGPLRRGADDVPARGHLVGPPHPLAPHLLRRDGTPPHAAVRVHRAGHGLDPRGADPPRLLPRAALRHVGRASGSQEAKFGGGVVDQLSLSPSEYWARQCHLGSSFIRRHEVAHARGRRRRPHHVGQRLPAPRGLLAVLAAAPPDGVRRRARGRGPDDGRGQRGRRLRLRLAAARGPGRPPRADRPPRSPSRSPARTSPTSRCAARRSPPPGSSASSPNGPKPEPPEAETNGDTKMSQSELAEPVMFNPLAEGFIEWPYDQYRRLRAEDPIHRSDLLHGYCVTRFADVNAILRDATVSSEIDKADPDPADHRRDPAAGRDRPRWPHARAARRPRPRPAPEAGDEAVPPPRGRRPARAWSRSGCRSGSTSSSPSAAPASSSSTSSRTSPTRCRSRSSARCSASPRRTTRSSGSG